MARGVGETAWGVAKGVVLVAMGGVGMAVAERAEAAVVEGMVGVAAGVGEKAGLEVVGVGLGVGAGGWVAGAVVAGWEGEETVVVWGAAARVGWAEGVAWEVGAVVAGRAADCAVEKSGCIQACCRPRQ